MRTRLAALTLLLTIPQLAIAEVPIANYIFPAGGRRGTTVAARIGGCNLHDAPRLTWSGTGVSVPAILSPTDTIWFEGPVIPQPASQQKEDYPRDFGASLQIAADAPSGRQTWRLSTSQGVTNSWGFVVGDLPEVVEHEVEGEAPAVRVTLPDGRMRLAHPRFAQQYRLNAGTIVESPLIKVRLAGRRRGAADILQHP